MHNTNLRIFISGHTTTLTRYILPMVLIKFTIPYSFTSTALSTHAVLSASSFHLLPTFLHNHTSSTHPSNPLVHLSWHLIIPLRFIFLLLLATPLPHVTAVVPSPMVCSLFIACHLPIITRHYWDATLLFLSLS